MTEYICKDCGGKQYTSSTQDNSPCIYCKGTNVTPNIKQDLKGGE